MYRPARMPLISMFQSLIGRLKTRRCGDIRDKIRKFQSLIGRLKTVIMTY